MFVPISLTIKAIQGVLINAFPILKFLWGKVYINLFLVFGSYIIVPNSVFIPIEVQAFLSIPLPSLCCIPSSLSACQLEAEWYGGVWHYLIGPIHRFKSSISYNKVGLHLCTSFKCNIDFNQGSNSITLIILLVDSRMFCWG